MGIDGINGAGGSQPQDGLLPKRDGVGYENFNLKQSLFTKLDTDKSGTISEEELCYMFTDKENLSNKEMCEIAPSNEYQAMKCALRFSERTINKFFRFDINFDGINSGLESERVMYNEMNQQFASRILKDYFPGNASSDEGIEQWGDRWVRDASAMCGQIAIAKQKYGVDLTDEQVQLLYDASIIQMNKWLFKDLSLYESGCNNSSYTRLVTSESTFSCCGGDVSAPPIGPQVKVCNFNQGTADPTIITEHTVFRPFNDENTVNNDYEVKNRLAWATFKTKPQEDVYAMSSFEYAAYQAEWQKVRDMTAADYRELLKPENAQARAKFEETSLMTVEQIVQYIDIVEDVCQVDYDSEGWQMTDVQFHEVCQRVDGNTQDENILTGKTRADIPPERLPLLKYLEDNGLLLDQFKETDDLDDMDI